jgi:hypothetical protein
VVSRLVFYFIFLIEKGEIVRVFLFLGALLFGIHLQQLILGLLSFLISWSLFVITDAVVTVVTSENSMARLTVASADIVGVLVRVSRAILVTILQPNCRCCRSDASLARGVTLVRIHLRHYIFSLPNVRGVFHAVGLLDEKHVSMVLGGFHNFWTSSPVLYIHPEALV